MDAELPVDPDAVRVDRLGAEVELRGYSLGREALSDEAHNLVLSGCEAVSPRQRTRTPPALDQRGGAADDDHQQGSFERNVEHAVAGRRYGQMPRAVRDEGRGGHYRHPKRLPGKGTHALDSSQAGPRRHPQHWGLVSV